MKIVKKILIVILLLFVWSGVAIALDQHDDKYSAFCPICFAKHILNGTQTSFVLNVPFGVALFIFKEVLFSIEIPILLNFEGRAPPAFS